MSLSFHDLFPGDDGESGNGAKSEEGRGGFSEKPKKEMEENRSIFSKPPSGAGSGGEQERKFLVSELLPFIPPAISAQSGIPMELEVAIPMPADGSSDVKLSSIYQACPDLFAAEITPLNDSEVTLPIKIGEVSEGGGVSKSPFTPGKAFGGMNDESTSEPPMTPDSDNPFWSPISERTAEDPDRSSAPHEPDDECPPAHPNPSKTFGGFDEPYSPFSEKEEFDSDPESEVDPVSSGFSENPFGGTESLHTLFTNKNDSDSEEEENVEEEPSTNWGSMFQAPDRDGPVSEDDPDANPETNAKGDTFSQMEGFEMPSFEPVTEPVTEPVAEPEPEPTHDEVAPEQDPPKPSIEWNKSPTEPAAEKRESPPESIMEKPEPTPEVVPERAEPPPKPVLEKPEPTPEVVPERIEPTSKPVEEPSLPAPEPKVEAAVPHEESKSEPVPSVSIARPAAESQDDDDLRDIELRAIFSTSDRFTLAKLARKIVGLPGIAACALSGAGKVVQATRSEENQLGADAHDMVDAVRNIAKLTGMDSAKSFTMKTEFGIVSLFLEGECCLSVNHEEGEFGPGVREKLIVIARSMHKLKD